MGGRGSAGGASGSSALGEKYESIFESGLKRVSYKEAMQEYGEEFTVKGTYQDGTIEVNPSPLVAKVMGIIPKSYFDEYKAADPYTTKAKTAESVVIDVRTSIKQGVTPPKESPGWVKDVYRYVKAGDAMENVYGYKKYSKQGIAEFHAGLKKRGTEKNYVEVEKKLRKKLKSFGF